MAKLISGIQIQLLFDLKFNSGGHLIDLGVRCAVQSNSFYEVIKLFLILSSHDMFKRYGKIKI